MKVPLTSPDSETEKAKQFTWIVVKAPLICLRLPKRHLRPATFSAIG